MENLSNTVNPFHSRSDTVTLSVNYIVGAMSIFGAVRVNHNHSITIRKNFHPSSHLAIHPICREFELNIREKLIILLDKLVDTTMTIFFDDLNIYKNLSKLWPNGVVQCEVTFCLDSNIQ